MYRRRFSPEWAAVVVTLFLTVCSVVYFGGRIVQSVDDLNRRMVRVETMLDDKQPVDKPRWQPEH